MDAGELIDNRYIIMEQIGYGGFGTVWKATDNENGGYVAVKSLRHRWLKSSRMIECFKNEFNLLKQLPDENTIRPLNLISDAGRYLIVMEYLAGGPLSQRIRGRGVLNIDAAISVVVKMLKVLNHSNRLGIVHKDIKPSNILFADDGCETPKLGDFGLAYFSAKHHGSTVHNRNSGTMGTLAYMPPEQLNGNRLNIKSDIYSLGMTLYKMITGRLFFRDDILDSQIIRKTICNSFREHPGRYRPEIPFWLDELIMRMISPEIYKRPENPQEILKVIELNRG